MTRKAFTRRRFIATSTAASASLIAAPFVRTAHAAGKLSIGFWDHWVPGANNASRALVEEWAAKEKVDVQIDYITSQGEKLRLTIAAESQARSGHDILTMGSWWPHAYAKSLEPVDDIMAELIKQNGAVDESVTFLGRAENQWVAVPATTGSQIKGPCSRIDLMKQHAGIDVQAMYPAGSPPNADNWTLDTSTHRAGSSCSAAPGSIRA
jgi:ABC-type glycerol-3-phosphate transport system substrate-binding protein